MQREIHGRPHDPRTAWDHDEAEKYAGLYERNGLAGIVAWLALMGAVAVYLAWPLVRDFLMPVVRD